MQTTEVDPYGANKFVITMAANPVKDGGERYF